MDWGWVRFEYCALQLDWVSRPRGDVSSMILSTFLVLFLLVLDVVLPWPNTSYKTAGKISLNPFPRAVDLNLSSPSFPAPVFLLQTTGGCSPGCVKVESAYFFLERHIPIPCPPDDEIAYVFEHDLRLIVRRYVSGAEDVVVGEAALVGWMGFLGQRLDHAV